MKVPIKRQRDLFNFDEIKTLKTLKLPEPTLISIRTSEFFNSLDLELIWKTFDRPERNDSKLYPEDLKQIYRYCCYVAEFGMQEEIKIEDNIKFPSWMKLIFLNKVYKIYANFIPIFQDYHFVNEFTFQFTLQYH